MTAEEYEATLRWLGDLGDAWAAGWRPEREGEADSILDSVARLQFASFATLAVLRGQTPQRVLEDAFKEAASDDDWREQLLPEIAAEGRRLIDEHGEAGDDSEPPWALPRS